MLRLEKVSAQVLKWVDVEFNGIMNHNPSMIANAGKRKGKTLPTNPVYDIFSSKYEIYQKYSIANIQEQPY